MSAVSPLSPLSSAPELAFAVTGASAVAHAAVPMVSFALRVDAPGGQPIRSVLLDVQIQIAARRRRYGTESADRLRDLFGPPEDWSRTLRTLPWLRVTKVVPAFTSTTEVALEVPCTYDLEISGARYFAALDDGLVPLELLFSGSVFYSTPQGALQTARIGWDRDTEFALPVAVWREAMDRHFPASAWLRLGADSYAALAAFKARHAHTSWDAAVAALLAGADRQ